MAEVVSMVVFAGAAALALAAIWTTVAPEWRRVLRLAAGHVEQPFQPLAHLALAERRIAVRRWAATPAPAALRRLSSPRAAA